MNQRHYLRASKPHEDSRTNRRRERGDDERAAIDEELDDVECIEAHNPDDPCDGPAELRESLTGTGTPIPRCDHHWHKRLDLQDDLNRRYPANPPPDFSWFDAGEYWGEDDY